MPDFVLYKLDEDGSREPAEVPEGTTRIVLDHSVTRLPLELCITLGTSPLALSTVTAIRFHPGIDYICPYAFTGFVNLTVIENASAMERLTTIQNRTFYSLGSLTSLDLSGCVTLTTVEGFAFNDCLALESVRLPDSVVSIGAGAFESCTHLEDFTIPSGVTSISPSTFAYCKSLKCIHIPANVASIHDGAFQGCKSLMTMTFAPDGECALVYLGSSFIDGCKSLKTFSLPPSVMDIHIDAFRLFSNRILLPWGQFEDGPGPPATGVYPMLTMAFVLLQRAGRDCGIPLHRLHSDNERTPTAVDLVNLLTALMVLLGSTDRVCFHTLPSRFFEIVSTQAIVLIVQGFPDVLLGNGEDPGIDHQIFEPDRSMLDACTTVTPLALVRKKRKSCNS
jgi:BspA type Leucine rich repeat region (6 copies)